MAWLNAGAGKWELYETGVGLGDEVRQCDPADFGNLRTSLAYRVSPSRPSQLVAELADEIESVCADVEVRCGHNGLRTWSIRGLAIAREKAGGIVFGLGRAEIPLGPDRLEEFQALAHRVARIRRPDSPDITHALYRAQPERWMESIVRDQLEKLDPDVTTGVVYEQLLAVSGSTHGLLDLLTVNATGRLAVVELKASEDIQLPLQALDYWMRVHWHNQRGELEGGGYFVGQKLSRQLPLLLLVSPALQFHSGCEVILRYLSPDIEVLQIGLNQDWRQSMQIVLRKRILNRHAER
jgi:hypothetical protein